MATNNVVYIIDSADGTLSFAIQPRTVDGIGGVQHTTDMTLYGNGAPSWGEKFNENFVHITENFATPESAVGIDGRYPLPQNDAQAGDGDGINQPLTGQNWFNKDREQMFQYSSTGIWYNSADTITSGIGSPNATAADRVGQLYWNVSTNTIEVYDGASWVSSAGAFVQIAGDTMTGFLELSADPVSDMQAVTKQYADGKFVELAGDDMSGPLNIWYNTPGPAEPGPNLNWHLGAWTVGEYADVKHGPVIIAGLQNATPHASDKSAVPAFELLTVDNIGWLSVDPDKINRAPVLRLTQRGGYAFNIELDRDLNGNKADGRPASTIPVLESIQSGPDAGVLVYHGATETVKPGDPSYNIIWCPNAPAGTDPIWDTGGWLDVLPTTRYMKQYVSEQISEPIFITPQVVTSSVPPNTNWIQKDANNYGVPTGAKAIILEYIIVDNQYGGPVSRVNIRRQSGYPSQILLEAGISNAQYHQGGQGIFYLSPTDAGFQYQITNTAIVQLIIQIIGYFS